MEDAPSADQETLELPARVQSGLRFLVLFAILLLPCGYPNLGDGYERFLLAEAIVLHGALEIAPERAMRDGARVQHVFVTPDGRIVPKYVLGMSLLWTPAVALAWLLHLATGLDFTSLSFMLISFVNPILTVLIAWSLERVGRQVGMSPWARVATIVCLLFACSTLAYANSAFSELLAALVIVWIAALAAVWDRPAWAGLLCAAAVHIKPELALLPVCVAPIWLRPFDGRRLLILGVSAAPGALLLLAFNYWQRGSPFTFGYGDEAARFGSPWNGLRGYFLELDYNLFVYNPALLLAVPGWFWLRRRSGAGKLAFIVLMFWVVYLPFYMSWYGWWGGVNFGPRFLFAFVPVTVLPAGLIVARACARRERFEARTWLLRGAVLLMFALSLPIQWSGLSVAPNQAHDVSQAFGLGELPTQVRLLALKLERGPRAREVYRHSDFAALPPGQDDREIHFDFKPTYHYLNHWWSFSLLPAAAPPAGEK